MYSFFMTIKMECNTVKCILIDSKIFFTMSRRNYAYRCTASCEYLIISIFASTFCIIINNWTWTGRAHNNIKITGRYWTMLADAGRYWPMLADSGICWSILDDAGWCWPKLADAGRCWPMLANAGRCWPMQDKGCWCWTILVDSI